MSEKIGQLKMTAPDGKRRFTDCASTETLFRIVQSIPNVSMHIRNVFAEGELQAGSVVKDFLTTAAVGSKMEIAAADGKALQGGGQFAPPLALEFAGEPA